MRIGLISDTHGLLRPEAVRALEGSELVIHAGDVGKPEVLEALRVQEQVRGPGVCEAEGTDRPEVITPRRGIPARRSSAS